MPIHGFKCNKCNFAFIKYLSFEQGEKLDNDDIEILCPRCNKADCQQTSKEYNTIN